MPLVAASESMFAVYDESCTCTFHQLVSLRVVFRTRVSHSGEQVLGPALSWAQVLRAKQCQIFVSLIFSLYIGRKRI